MKAFFKEYAKEIIIAVCGIIFVVGIIFLITYKSAPITVYAESKEWVRNISITKMEWVHHEQKGTYYPDGAINIRKWNTIESRVSIVNGKSKITLMTVHHIAYDAYERIHSRNIKTQSFYPDKPSWGIVVLNNLIEEKESGRIEKYVIHFIYKQKNKTYTCKNENEYNNIKVQGTYKVIMGIFGGIKRVNL